MSTIRDFYQHPLYNLGVNSLDDAKSILRLDMRERQASALKSLHKTLQLMYSIVYICIEKLDDKRKRL